MFDHFSKQLEIRPKYSATSLIFKSLLGVWKCGQTRSFVFDILLKLHSFMSNITRKHLLHFCSKIPTQKGHTLSAKHLSISISETKISFDVETLLGLALL